ncbi:hypothetical protein H0H93_006252 [Arthromyces matolae]|nr:hypothetical protein H0H93_006252 [Arthromyces matolae]
MYSVTKGATRERMNGFNYITGRQRIDLFGAKTNGLPAIWDELNNAGFEIGYVYGKSSPTVKSCIGTTCT